MASAGSPFGNLRYPSWSFTLPGLLFEHHPPHVRQQGLIAGVRPYRRSRRGPRDSSPVRTYCETYTVMAEPDPVRSPRGPERVPAGMWIRTLTQRTTLAHPILSQTSCRRQCGRRHRADPSCSSYALVPSASFLGLEVAPGRAGSADGGLAVPLGAIGQHPPRAMPLRNRGSWWDSSAATAQKWRTPVAR